jgi:hypothetical protein
VLHGTDKNFPANLWCSLLEQTNTQINLLRQSRINPRHSAYAELHSHFDFNSTPLAILGSKAAAKLDGILAQPCSNTVTTVSTAPPPGASAKATVSTSSRPSAGSPIPLMPPD